MASDKYFENCSITTSEVIRDEVSYKAVWVLKGLNQEGSRNFLINGAKLAMQIGDEGNGYTLQFRLKVKKEITNAIHDTKQEREELGIVARLINPKPETEAGFEYSFQTLNDCNPSAWVSGYALLDKYTTEWNIDNILLLKQNDLNKRQTGQYSSMFYSSDQSSYSQMEDYSTEVSAVFRLGVIITPIDCNTVARPPTDNTETFAQKSNRVPVTSMHAVFRDFGTFYAEGQDNFSDLKLESKDGAIISAHKFVLGARCAAFPELIEMTTKQNGFDGTIMITEVNAKPLMALLHWMYTGELENGVEKFIGELVAAAEKFEMIELLQTLDKEIIKICKKDNMLELLQMAQKNNMETAVKQISKFIKENL